MGLSGTDQSGVGFVGIGRVEVVPAASASSILWIRNTLRAAERGGGLCSDPSSEPVVTPGEFDPRAQRWM